MLHCNVTVAHVHVYEHTSVTLASVTHSDCKQLRIAVDDVILGRHVNATPPNFYECLQYFEVVLQYSAVVVVTVLHQVLAQPAGHHAVGARVLRGDVTCHLQVPVYASVNTLT